jgi:Uncharacterised nucleotidyltransferase
LSNVRAKRAVLSALGHEPQFHELTGLPCLNSRAGIEVMKWLDWSGLALPFFARLRRFEADAQLSVEWHRALSERLARNVERTEDMLQEAQRINAAFRSLGIKAALLKGFTLAPDFSDDPCFRHQVDFDFLVTPASAGLAAEALHACGYSAAHLTESGETCFRTASRHIPSAHDDIYTLQRQRQVDLHISIWEPCAWLPVESPQDCLEQSQTQTIHGAEFLSLALEDKFLLQVLHAFRHSFRSWMRAAWLLEIACCFETHQENVALWKRVIQRAGSTRLTKSIFAFVLGLIERLFAGPIPSLLRNWTADASTASLQTWLDHFAFDWATSDWPGSLNNLFLTAEFIPDPRLRRKYWRSRLFPRKEQTSLGPVAATGAKQFLQLRAARLSYVAQRAALHLKDIAALPVQQMRWRRALDSSRGANLDTNW